MKEMVQLPSSPKSGGPAVLLGTSEDREEELAHQKSGLTIKCASGIPLEKKKISKDTKC